MDEYLVVDGYNIIYAWPQLENLKLENLSHARDKLLDYLTEYSALTGCKVILVFDAHQVPLNARFSEVINGVEVIYSREGETADSVIEKMVSSLTKKGKVFVATSDGDEQFVVFGQGAYRVTPQELWDRLQKLKKETQEKTCSSSPVDNYLENRLHGDLRQLFESWRRS